MLKLVSPASLFHSLMLNKRIKQEERCSMVLTSMGIHPSWRRGGTSTKVSICWNGKRKTAFFFKQFPRVNHVWYLYFSSSMFPRSWWMNVLTPTSPLHQDQSAPLHCSGVWIWLPLNPIFCISMSKKWASRSVLQCGYLQRKVTAPTTKMVLSKLLGPKYFLTYFFSCFHICLQNLCNFFAVCSFPKSKSFGVFIPLKIQIILFPGNYLFCIQLHSWIRSSEIWINI